MGDEDSITPAALASRVSLVPHLDWVDVKGEVKLFYEM